MSRLTVSARRSGDVKLMLHAAKAARSVRVKRALVHMQRHSWPAPLTGMDYGSVLPALGYMARFL
jgi:hypothetical protein